MGFFSKLFEKKECAVCGGEIGLLGNRKLEDGNLCKHCAAKLSPWFQDRRSSTVAEIKEQLAYRARNQAELQNFRVARCIGRNDRVFIEEENGVPVRFVVSASKDYMEENADIIRFVDVASCNIDIDTSSHELKHPNDRNEMVSYNPPRFHYEYNFYVEMHILNNSYFDDIRFKLNDSSVEIETGHNGFSIAGLFGFGTEADPSINPEYQEYKKMCDELEQTVRCGQKGMPYDDALLYGEPAGRRAEAGPQARFCSECGAPASGGKFCQNCGSRL